MSAWIPDIDTISFFFGEAGFYTYHRVATHSFIGVVLLALIIAVLFSRLKKQEFVRYFPLAMLGVLSHLFLDFVTAAQGAQIFYPFSTAKVALSISPGVDIYLLTIFAAGLFCLQASSQTAAKNSSYCYPVCDSFVQRKVRNHKLCRGKG